MGSYLCWKHLFELQREKTGIKIESCWKAAFGKGKGANPGTSIGKKTGPTATGFWGSAGPWVPVLVPSESFLSPPPRVLCQQHPPSHPAGVAFIPGSEWWVVPQLFCCPYQFNSLGQGPFYHYLKLVLVLFILFLCKTVLNISSQEINVTFLLSWRFFLSSCHKTFISFVKLNILSSQFLNASTVV